MKMISRKIWVTEKPCNFHTVQNWSFLHNFFHILDLEAEFQSLHVEEAPNGVDVGAAGGVAEEERRNPPLQLMNLTKNWITTWRQDKMYQDPNLNFFFVKTSQEDFQNKKNTNFLTHQYIYSPGKE